MGKRPRSSRRLCVGSQAKGRKASFRPPKERPLKPVATERDERIARRDRLDALGDYGDAKLAAQPFHPGMSDLVANFVKEGAKANVATLAKIASRVDGLVGGDDDARQCGSDLERLRFVLAMTAEVSMALAVGTEFATGRGVSR
jgi:hypothetical protein